MRPVLDPTKMPAWQLVQAAEPHLRPIPELASDWGLEPDEVLPWGRNLAKVDHLRTLKRIGGAPRRSKYIVVTAITPTPLGEGKTTTTIGLVEGLAHLGKKASGAIRQGSSAPTFNVKGGAAGGGLALCLPLAPGLFGLTGDIDRITNAHNLGMVALSARMQHEANYDDARLAQIGLRRLDIDPARVSWNWVIDFAAQSLRRIRMGLGGKMDGFEMDSGFAVSVSSELMAILAVARDLGDLRSRIARIRMAESRSGRPVTAADLEVDGAMAAWLVQAMDPNLMQTLEGQPMLVHAGPFANIALGQSSVVADRIALNLSDYHVTESGFGADIGFEKFMDLKCPASGFMPDAAVLVCTMRALKMHGGGPEVKPGKPLDDAYTQENLDLLRRGTGNLRAHIEIVRGFGIEPVVCINHFPSDTRAEEDLIRGLCSELGVRCAVSKHWLLGGAGAAPLAEAVIDACATPARVAPRFDDSTALGTRIERIATEVYGADGVDFAPVALERLARMEADPGQSRYGVCMVKTQYSISHDPRLLGRPTGWRLPVRDILAYDGARLACPLAGDIKLMPGTGSNPAFRHMDIDCDTGQVTGIL